MSDIRQLPSSPTMLKPPVDFKCVQLVGPRPCSPVAFAGREALGLKL